MKTVEILRSHKAQIIDNWLKRIKEEMPVISNHDKSAIQNDVPLLIDAIIEKLSDDCNSKITRHSRQHGYQRTKFREYSLHHIIREYNYLTIEILSFLDDNELHNSNERNIILMSINQAIEESAEVYFRIKQSVQVNARKIAEKKARDLEIEDQNREEFIHSLSHDLNNPLSNIKACIDLMEEDLDVGQLSSVLRILKSSTDQAQSLIKNFLDVGKIGTNEKLPVKKNKLEIVEDIRNEIQVYKVSHKSKIHLSSNQDEIYANIDALLLRRALNNLINNALKHGDDEAEISVACNLKDSEIQISVQNRGKVIPENIIGNIFNRYYQADGSAKGWGIGLAFVKEVVNAHGGKVNVHSSPGDGTRFTMCFPL